MAHWWTIFRASATMVIIEPTSWRTWSIKWFLQHTKYVPGNISVLLKFSCSWYLHHQKKSSITLSPVKYLGSKNIKNKARYSLRTIKRPIKNNRIIIDTKVFRTITYNYWLLFHTQAIGGALTCNSNKRWIFFFRFHVYCEHMTLGILFWIVSGRKLLQ